MALRKSSAGRIHCIQRKRVELEQGPLGIAGAGTAVAGVGTAAVGTGAQSLAGCTRAG